MGNSGISKIMGIDDIRLNLISTSRLNDEGFTNYFSESKWKLTKDSLEVAIRKKQNNIYVMEAKLHKGEINETQRDVSIELWHRMLGHISEKELQTLARNQFLPNLQRIPLKTCDHCLVGKTHRVAFHKFTI